MKELEVLATEIHEQAVADFKVSERFAYSFIMKVKKIRDDRLYKELGFTNFEYYCESAWNVKRGYMDDRILVAESFGEDFDRTCGQLGHKKSLLLARMEPEIRQQVEATISVDAATVKQLKEIERQLVETEQRAAKAEATAAAEKNSAHHYEKLWKQEKARPPVIQTQRVEVIPDRVQKEMEELKFNLTNVRHGYQEAEAKLKQYELKQTDGFDPEMARIQREKLQHEAEINALQVVIQIKNFMEKAAITSFMEGALATADPITKRKVSESVEMLEKYARQIKAAVNGRILGGIINE